MEKEVTIKGIPSRDSERFCFEVTAEEYKRIAGRYPIKEFEKSNTNKELYRIYPDRFYENNKLCETTIKIKY